MLDMMYASDISNSKVTWNEFINAVNADVKSLNDRKTELLDIEKKADKFSEIMSDSNKIIENKSLFIELDSSLISEFNKLEFFQSKNNLDNKMAEAAINKITNNKKVVEISTVPITSKTECESISSRLKVLEDILHGEITPEVIVEVARLHNMSDDEIKRILFYYLYKATTDVDDMIDVDKNETFEIEVNQEYNNFETEKDTYEEPTIQGEITTFADVPILNIEDEVSVIDMYETIKNDYDKIRSENKDLMTKYSMLLKDTKPLSSYLDTPSEQLYEIGFSNEDIAQVVAYRLFKAKENAENYINLVMNDVSLDNSLMEEDCNNAIKYMTEFKDILTELISLDGKCLTNAVESVNLRESILFFAHNEDGYILVPNDEDCLNKIGSIMNNMDESFNSNDINEVTKLPNVEEEVRFLGRDIYMLLSNPSISYVLLNYNGEEAEFIITVDQKAKISEKTSQLLLRYGDEVLNQIASIEQNNPEELERQALIREALMNDEEGL